MTGPFGERVIQHTRVKATQPDSLGNDVWTDTDVTWDHVTISPLTSTELVQGQDTNFIGLKLTFKPAITVLPTDEFTARGKRSTVDGMPGQYSSSLTGTTITEVHLTRVEG